MGLKDLLNNFNDIYFLNYVVGYMRFIQEIEYDLKNFE